MPQTIFDIVQSPAIAAYWEQIRSGDAPYLGDELFPANKKLGLDLTFIKGSKGLPVVLNPSAFDVKAIPRERIGFDTISTDMPFFKGSLYIDEKLRQMLNIALGTGNQAYIDSLLNNVFDDEMQLIRGAAAQRERMRMQLLTTGAIAISANGENLAYDYGLPSDHKKEVSTSWSSASAKILDDIQAGIDKIEGDTGVRPVRAVCSLKTMMDITKNTEIRKSTMILTNGDGFLSKEVAQNYISQMLGIEVQVYSKKYKNEAGQVKQFIPDDLFVMFPSGSLGTTWFGTTPEESDLMTGSTAAVSIVDTGVAITTIKHADPVNVETKASMICLPSFEMADQVYILDTAATA